MNKSCSIAVILPLEQSDYLANTVLDGLLDLAKDYPILNFRITEKYPSPFGLKSYALPEEKFINYAFKADLIFLIWGKKSTNFKLAEEINCWDKTVFIDGSELGKNNRYDFDIQRAVSNLQYEKDGKIDVEMLKKCKLYFRRERPYINGIIPLPFGIESRYLEKFSKDKEKDIDFACMFGQDEYPILRRQVAKITKKFCRKNNFKCFVGRTSGFSFDDETKQAGRSDFYDILSRSKVGISVGGGGFDTARFWEILANNCILLTEKIDIYEPNSKRLNYNCVWQFSDKADFEDQLEKLGDFLRKEYNQKNMIQEYKKIISEHSSKARVLEIINAFKNANK